MSSLATMFALVVAFWLTAFAVLCKLAGVLLLSWWCVLSPMPLVILAALAWFYFCAWRGIEWE